MRFLAAALLAACAAVDDPGSVAVPIINGTSDAGKDPAVVLLQDFNARGDPVATCTGTLITPLVVLTAAHCADGSAGDAAYAVSFADGYDTRTNQYTGLIAVRSVASKWVHPLFDENQLQTGYDMALLLLAEAAPAEVAPISLDRTRVIAAGTPVRVVGFGLTLAGSTSTARVKETARSQVAKTVNPRLFEIVAKSASPCNGDSGGPALVTVGDREVLAGVVSYGDNNCAVVAGYTWVAGLVADIDAFVMANDAADYGQCGADGMCGFGCSTVDPDCPCDADGACTTDCPDPELDPDCPRGCGQNGVCVRSGCPAHDPDCLDLPDGMACSSHNDCASDLCVGTGSGTVCVPPCDASGNCPTGTVCSMPARACIPPASGCAIGGGGAGGWLAPLLLLGLLRRRHHVADRRQLA